MDMDFLRWCRPGHIIIVLCAHLVNAATESPFTATTNAGTTNREPLVSATPAPGTVDFTSVGTTEAGTAMDTTRVGTTEAGTVDSTPDSTPGCLCDLTPDFCDIGCCCDTVDCGVANLSTVFTGCPQKSVSGVCIEKWLMFRANVNSSLVTETDSLFCVRSQDDAPQLLSVVSQYPALGDSYHFSPPTPASIVHSRAFYRADDVIQTYLSSSSVRGFLRQPGPGIATAFCMNHNPARFLRSVSLSCTRMLTPQSCTTDPNLSARSYFFDLRLIKTPKVETEPVSTFLIPVTPLSDWPAPSQQNNSCINVVKKVEFVIGYTSRGELKYATVNVILGDVDPNQLLSQTHSVLFKLATPNPTPREPIPSTGLRVGSPVIGRFIREMTPLTTVGVSPSGECSSDPSRRAPILFTHNTITGCAFSSPSNDCSVLHSQIYEILQGTAIPDEIAMNSGSQLNWTRVIAQECPISMKETCETGCVLPKSLSIRVLWARQGSLDLFQNYILGAKYLFQCQNIKCPVSSPLSLTTEVTFVDTTVYPEPPRGSPQPNWKFPFGFFTRGTAELDGHIVLNSSVTVKVTWSFMLFTVILITGLEFFTR
ncbi:tectonic-3-like isoform X2 [Mastacembelus armatus]|uniref:tectonic-3-like isoform X2 n=1 Tax=Mastacembelus armatus TaxID=205130 RepID=UPI000E456630|nr:tectonic-3 isoform X2 [Mastacembelus armatus]